MGFSLREKLEVTERLSELSSKFIAQRKKAGLPYIDPYTGEAYAVPAIDLFSPAKAPSACFARSAPKEAFIPDLFPREQKTHYFKKCAYIASSL